MKFQEIVDADRWAQCMVLQNYVNENRLWKPFMLVEDEDVAEEDKVFLCKLMKLDPRDRPTAKELLQDEWLRQS